MLRRYYAYLFFFFFFAALTTSLLAEVNVTSPWNDSTVGTSVHYVASGTTSCDKGVASMGIYVDNDLKYVSDGDQLNTDMSFGPGSYNTVVEEWDYCGGATYTPVAITATNKTGVWVMAPANNGSVGSPVNYVATATTYTCSKGVASMGVYINDVLTYVSQGASLNTNLSFSSGTYNTVVEEWDYCGGASYTPIKITVGGGSSGDPTLHNIQASGGWNSWGEYPPDYSTCNPCGSGVTWSMKQHVNSPSMSGNATQFNIGGSTPYSDVLWSNPLIGQGSTQGLPDNNHTLLPTLYNFTYDAYFYTSDLSVVQNLEFDISMYFDGHSLIWGHQCNLLGGNVWDIWDNVNSKWVSTGVSCYPVNNGWNHVTLQVQRESDNTLLFQSITFNGVQHDINQYYAPGTAPQGWWGITVNYQMDGDYKQSAYTTFLDDFNFSY
jgi:hypothetical protein